jgi:hypothetical protein
VLLPVVISLVLVRFSMDARKSRGRIKILESDESYSERLIEIVGRMEKRIEGMVVDYMDEPGGNVSRSEEPAAHARAPGSSTTLTATLTATAPGVGKEVQAVVKAQTGGISDLQRRMVKHLDALPNLERKLAFIDMVFNSHAVIVARDVKRFQFHTRGHGVLRHLADHMLL